MNIHSMALAASLAMLLPMHLQASESKPLPNIVYILADDLGYGDVSCLNPDSKIRTPNIDRLANDGMIFTDAHSNSAVCTPTRYGVLTGRYAWRTHLREGVLWGFSKPLIDRDRMTVASLLKEQGYQTGMVGKWHLGMEWPLLEPITQPEWNFLNPRFDWTKAIENGPTARGFDSFFGISASLDMPPYCYINKDRPVGTPTETKAFWKKRFGPATPDFDPEKVLPEFTAKAVEYIADSAKKPEPFFLYLALNSPHTPIAPSKKFQGKSGISPYADFVMETDWAVGQVLEALDKAGAGENTLVIFTSDNGCSPEANFEELAKAGHNPNHIFRGAKADIWEGGHRVPFIARWPARVKAGSVSSDPVCLTDLMATAAGINGVTLPPDAGEDSVSMLPILLGTGKATSRTGIVHQSIDGALSIREGKWKLEFCPGSGGWSHPKDAEARGNGLPELQLYDLDADLGETMNVQAAHPDVVKRLTAGMKKIIADGRSTPGPVQPNDIPVVLALSAK